MEDVDGIKEIVRLLEQNLVPLLARCETIPGLRDLSERGFLVADAMDGEARDLLTRPKARR